MARRARRQACTRPLQWQGDRARGGQLRRAEGAVAAAVVAAAARRLRLRPRHVFRRPRRRRARDGTITALEPRAAAASSALAAAMRAARRIDARNPAVLGGDARAIATALLTGGATRSPRPSTTPLFVSGLGHVLSISGYHRDRRRRRVLRGARAAGAVSAAHGDVPDQEMGGCGGAGRGGVLPAAVRRRGRHATLVPDDGGGAGGGDGGPPRDHLPHAGDRGAGGARGRARGAGASELPAVVRRVAGAGGAGAGRDAAPVRLAPTIRRWRARRCGAAASLRCCCWPRWSPGLRRCLTPRSTSTASRRWEVLPTSRRCRWCRCCDAGRALSACWRCRSASTACSVG